MITQTATRPVSVLMKELRHRPAVLDGKKICLGLLVVPTVEEGADRRLSTAAAPAIASWNQSGRSEDVMHS